jgi:hypothetical protein
MRVLPVVNGYVMDARCREFRRLDPDSGLEFVPFASVQGATLLAAFYRQK